MVVAGAAVVVVVGAAVVVVVGLAVVVVAGAAVVIGAAVVVGATETDGVEFVDTALATHFNFPDTFLHTSGFLSVPDIEPIFLQVPPALAADTAENGRHKINEELITPTASRDFVFTARAYPFQLLWNSSATNRPDNALVSQATKVVMKRITKLDE